MNKLIAPLLLILIFATSSCSDDAKKGIQNIARQDSEQTSTDVTGDKTILNAGLGNFCEGHECPDGIVAVKTNTKKLTCAGIVKSENEVLISNNCATKDDNFNVQITEGKLLKVSSVEEELTNEFGNKVLKLNLDEKISSTANIDLPELDDHNVTLFNFNELGELQSQDCELTYASLAYANSFDNESQLLNIKNCDGVRDGSLISQNGKTIGFLTKKHDEIDLYEGISLGGVNPSLISNVEKFNNIAFETDNIPFMFVGVYLEEFDLEPSNFKINKNKYGFTIEDNIPECIDYKLDPITPNKLTLSYDSLIQEISIDTKVKETNYIVAPLERINFGNEMKNRIARKKLGEWCSPFNLKSRCKSVDDIFYKIEVPKEVVNAYVDRKGFDIIIDFNDLNTFITIEKCSQNRSDIIIDIAPEDIQNYFIKSSNL